MDKRQAVHLITAMRSTNDSNDVVSTAKKSSPVRALINMHASRTAVGLAELLSVAIVRQGTMSTGLTLAHVWAIIIGARQQFRLME